MIYILDVVLKVYLIPADHLKTQVYQPYLQESLINIYDLSSVITT